MMTIKEFASLCGCSAQTLRYYDKIDLLKPVKVDPWSGYRYYDKKQAVSFVKIKNLQAADFTIDEIKALLSMTDAEVYEAFDRKIIEQAQKLERIREIQRSYLTEKNNMEKLIQSVSDFLLHAISDFEVLREFGLSPEEGHAVVQQLRAYTDRQTAKNLPASPEDVRMIVNDKVICGVDHIVDMLAELKGQKDKTLEAVIGDEEVRMEDGFTPDNSEKLWECHGWSFVSNFLDAIPSFAQGYDYCCCFALTEDKYRDGLEFPMFTIAAMIPRLEDEDIAVGCIVERSTDEENHFTLLRRPKKLEESITAG